MHAQESASNTVAKGKSNAPEGWPFEAEGGEMDLPSEIEALLEQKTAEQAESPRTGVEEEPGNEGLPMLGTNSSPEDLQGLPKVDTLCQLVIIISPFCTLRCHSR